MGKLLAIAQREKTKAPMEEITSASVTFEHGVGTDSRGKKRNHRQVTVLSKESWDDTCGEMNLNMPWTTRRANLLIEGIPLENTTGKRLQIGSMVVEITGELEPCARMDQQFDGLTQTLTSNWRGGVTCRLIEEGEICVGDLVKELN